MDVLTNHLNLYERASDAKLNHHKTEGDERDKPNINVQVNQEMKILGLTFCCRDCSERNWEKKTD